MPPKPRAKTPGPVAGVRPAPGKVKSRRSGPAYRANLVTRAGACALDAVIGFVPGAMFFILGYAPLALLPMLLYLLVRDGLPIDALDYQSIGKKLVGMNVELTSTGESRIDAMTSVKRNLPLCAGLIAYPALAYVHLALALLVAVVPPLVELFLAAKDANGLRYGDRLAGTKVYD